MPSKKLNTINNEIFREYDGPYADRSFPFMALKVFNANLTGVMSIIDPELFKQAEQLRQEFEATLEVIEDEDIYYGLVKGRGKLKMTHLGGDPEKRGMLRLAHEEVKKEFIAYKDSLTGEDEVGKDYLELIQAIVFPENGEYLTAYQDSFYFEGIVGLIGTGLKLKKKTVNGRDVVDFASIKANLSKPDGKGYFAPYMGMCKTGASLIRLESEMAVKKREGWNPGEEKVYLERLAELQTEYERHFQELRKAVHDNPGIYDEFLENDADHETGWDVLNNARNQICTCAHMLGQAQAVRMGWNADELPLLGYISEMEANLARLREENRLLNLKDDGTENKGNVVLHTKQVQEAFGELKNKIWNIKVTTPADKRKVLAEIDAFHEKYGAYTLSRRGETLNSNFKNPTGYGRFFDGLNSKLTSGRNDDLKLYPEEERKIEAFRKDFGIKEGELPFTGMELAYLAATGISGIELAVSKGEEGLAAFVQKHKDKIDQEKLHAENVAKAYAAGNKNQLAEILHRGLRDALRRFRSHQDPADYAVYDHGMIKAFTEILARDPALKAAFREIDQAMPESERVDIDMVTGARRVAGRSLGKSGLLETWIKAGQELNNEELNDKTWFCFREERSRAARKLIYRNGIQALIRESGSSRLGHAMDHVGTGEGMQELERLFDRLYEENVLRLSQDGKSLTVNGVPFLQDAACRDEFELFMTEAANKGILRRLEKEAFTPEQLRAVTREYMMNLLRADKLSHRKNTGVEDEYLKTDPETEMANMDKHIAIESAIMGYVNSFDFKGITGGELAQHLRKEKDFFRQAMQHTAVLVDNQLWSSAKKRRNTKLSSVQDAIDALEKANKGLFISSKEYKDILKDLVTLEKDLKKAEEGFVQAGNWQYDGAGLAAREKKIMNRLQKYISRKDKELQEEESRTAEKRKAAAVRALEVLGVRYEQDRKLPTVTKENLTAARSFEGYSRLSVEESAEARANFKPAVPQPSAGSEGKSSEKNSNKKEPVSTEKIDKRRAEYKSFKKSHSRDADIQNIFQLLNSLIPASSDTTPMTEQQLAQLKFTYTGAIMLLTNKIKAMEKNVANLPKLISEYDRLTRLKKNPAELAKLSQQEQNKAREGINLLPASKEVIDRYSAQKKEYDLLSKVRKTLSKDLRVVDHCLRTKKRPTGAELFEDARSLRMTYDLSKEEIMGGNMSQRIPITLKNSKGQDVTGPDGKPLKGFFTESKQLLEPHEYEKEMRKEIKEEYGEAGNILENLDLRRAASFIVRDKDFGIDILSKPAKTFLLAADELSVEPVKNSLKDIMVKLFNDAKYEEAKRTPYLNALNEIKTVEQLRAFIDYMHGVKKLSNSTLINMDMGFRKGTVIDKRNSASSLVAELIGRPDIIAGSRNLQIRKNGKGKAVIGTFMEYAKGHDLGSLKKEDMELFNHLTPSKLEGNLQLKKDIADLQILDYLIGNPDRHLLNLFYVFDENGRLVGIQGIDNDTTFSSKNHAVFLQGINLENLSVITKKTADALKKLYDNKEAYKNMLYGYKLSDAEVDTAILRLEKIVTKIEMDAPAFEGKAPEELIDGRIRIVNDDELGRIPIYGGLDSGAVMKNADGKTQGRKNRNLFQSIAGMGNGGLNLKENKSALTYHAQQDNADYARGAKRLGRLLKEIELVDGKYQIGSENFTNMRNAVAAYQKRLKDMDISLIMRGRRGIKFVGDSEDEIKRIDDVIKLCDKYINGKNAEKIKKLSPDNRTFKRFKLAEKCKAEMLHLKKLYLGIEEKLDLAEEYGSLMNERWNLCNDERKRLTDAAKANLKKVSEKQAEDQKAIAGQNAVPGQNAAPGQNANKQGPGKAPGK